MRADRLLSMLMLLQTRGRMTAQQLADELEVSVRTIYRDIEALSVAGVPVYAERGPGGGCALLDSYRTNLTGLTDDEARALFMLSIPAPLADLGVSQALQGALRKLAAALPDARRAEEERARQRIHLDSTPWFQQEEPTPCLQTIHQAVWEDRKLHITYRLPFETHVAWLVEPYGLVAKASTWHLVGAVTSHPAGNVRAFRVADILEARLDAATFARPVGFDLAAFWRAWRAGYAGSRPCYRVTLRVAPALAPLLPRYFGAQIEAQRAHAASDAEGWVTLTVAFESLEAARDRILGFGRAVEVLEPEPLRRSVTDFARQIVAFYDEVAG
ncbi:MAG: YafY family transcriptional regulator [Anaerolineae bacterium]|nr:YafY family transcriptional regulator [Anaerolineae bacterium]